MERPRFEVADVIRMVAAPDGAVPGLSTTSSQRYVLRALMRCRTAALGGHVDACTTCGHQRPSYNSCRNRHCPKCQASNRAEWLDARLRDLLPVHYFHVVFTLPRELAPLALQNKGLLYGLLFTAASETLKEIAADPKHLGAQIGFIAVLHTWGQTLQHHPHLHCVVPGGGLSADGKRWVATRPNYLLPIKVLSRVFRGKYLAKLKHLYEDGRLVLEGRLQGLRQPEAFRSMLRAVRRHEWVVYTKPPFGGPDVVLKYLARYTHRVAIANSRIVSIESDSVTFRYKDYARGGAWRTMQLRPGEFLRRFLLHVLPHGFTRIRHYGLLANTCRRERLAQCRALLGPMLPLELPEPVNDSVQPEPTCPVCSRATWLRVAYLDPQPTTGPPTSRAA